MSRKMMIASIIFAVVIVVWGGVGCLLWSGAAQTEKREDGSASAAKKVLDKYLESYEMKNYVANSKKDLEKGDALLFNQRPTMAGIKLVPSLSMKFKQEVSFYGYVMDKYNNVFARLMAYPDDTDKGTEVVLFWPAAKAHWNDDYYFYVALFKEDEYLFSIKFPPIQIKIKDNDYPKGFYIVSPPIDVAPEGLTTGSMVYSQTPIIAWVDTQNVDVLKYQLFNANVELDSSIKPYEDNIAPSRRETLINRPLVLSRILAKKEGDIATGSYAFLVRAILRNGKHVDSTVSSGLLIEPPNRNIVITEIRYEKKE